METTTTPKYRRRLPSESVVLLNALRAAYDKSFALAKPLAVDWTAVFQRAEQNGITPWVSEFIDGDLGRELNPTSDMAERFRASALRRRGDFEVACRLFEEVAYVLEDARQAFLPVGAVVFGKRLYPRPYRQLTKFEILVPAPDLPRAREAFLDAGFAPNGELLQRGEARVALSAELLFDIGGENVRTRSEFLWERASSREGAQFDVPFEDHAVMAAARAARSGAMMEEWLDCLLADRACEDLGALVQSSDVLDASPSLRWQIAGFVADLRAVVTAASEMEVSLELATKPLVERLVPADRARQSGHPTPRQPSAWLRTLRRLVPIQST